MPGRFAPACRGRRRCIGSLLERGVVFLRGLGCKTLPDGLALAANAVKLSCEDFVVEQSFASGLVAIRLR